MPNLVYHSIRNMHHHSLPEESDFLTLSDFLNTPVRLELQNMEEKVDHDTLLMLIDPRSPLKGRSPPPYFARVANIPNKNLLGHVLPHRIAFDQSPTKEPRSTENVNHNLH